MNERLQVEAELEVYKQALLCSKAQYLSLLQSAPSWLCYVFPLCFLNFLLTLILFLGTTVYYILYIYQCAASSFH